MCVCVIKIITKSVNAEVFLDQACAIHIHTYLLMLFNYYSVNDKSVALAPETIKNMSGQLKQETRVAQR